MKLAVVSRHLPETEGTAAGRILLATHEGLCTLGHEVTTWSWGPEPPVAPLPEGCTWAPLDSEQRFRNRLWSFVRPRDETARAGWSPGSADVAVADEPLSFGAVRRHARSVVTVHFLTQLDRRAVGRIRARDIQSQRAEQRIVRDARVVLAYSPRLVDTLGRGEYVPVAIPIPPAPAPFVDEPVAVLLANWHWEPNRQAGQRLVRAWPDLLGRVPDARLVLAGRGSREALGGSALPRGVTIVGAVDRSRDVLDRGAVLAFPCPPTSGPKVKVLEALAAGVPVVTTPSGVEGLDPTAREQAVVTSVETFAQVLGDVLLDVERRRTLAGSSPPAIASTHGPEAAAGARVAVLERAFDL